MRQLSMRIGVLVLAVSCTLGVAAQEPGEEMGGRGGAAFAGMQRVAGTVTAVSGSAVTVKAEDGTVYQVTTTPNTRFMNGQRAAVKIADLKAGDGVTAGGNMDAPNKTLHAAFVLVVDAEQLKKLRENLGKTYIAGKITAIDTDNLKITVQRQDGVSQTIGLDDSTSFKRGGRGGRGAMGAMMGNPAGAAAAPTEGGESITLADVKVGDNVVGPGTVKAGVFVPTQLNVGRERQGGGRRGGPGALGGPGSAAAAPAAKPQP